MIIGRVIYVRSKTRNFRFLLHRFAGACGVRRWWRWWKCRKRTGSDLPWHRDRPANDPEEQVKRVERRHARAVAAEEAEREIEISGIGWPEINAIYNLKSKNTDVQKDAAWPRFKGKRVQWSGTVAEIFETFGNVNLHVKMNPETFTSDLIIQMRKDHRDRALAYKKDDRVAFKGTLKDWGTLMPITLSDGEFFDPAEDAIARRGKKNRGGLMPQGFGRKNGLKQLKPRRRPNRKPPNLPSAKKPRRKRRASRLRRKRRLARKTAASKLSLAKQFNGQQKPIAKRRLQELIDTYPETEAVTEAKKLLKSL